MSTISAQKQGNKNAEKFIRAALTSLIAALVLTAIVSLIFAKIMVSKKVPLYAAVPMASISVGAGSFLAGFIQGKALKQNGMLLSVFTALLIAAACALAGFPSWQPPYFTAVSAARGAVILIASVLGNQIGKNLSQPAKRIRRKGRK